MNDTDLTAMQYAHGNLRPIFNALMNYEGKRDWDEIFLPQWAQLKHARAYFDAIKNRPCEHHAWPELVAGESTDLYCASRLNDVMLLRFQDSEVEQYGGPVISLENYIAFFEHIGFTAETPARFHPFWCEVVSVIESEAQHIELVDVVWPALTLGSLMFSRAGVTVSAPKALLAKGVADNSVLYWSYRRKYRPTTDLSVGWGSNSQWGTDLRRDYDLGDRYAYNVDSWNKNRDLRFPEFGDCGEYDLDQWKVEDRIDLLKNRCLTKLMLENDHDFWPYHDYFEELKSAP